MARLPQITSRHALILLHDLLTTAVAALSAVGIRFEGEQLDQRLPIFMLALPCLLVLALAVYLYFELPRLKWRFASLPDFITILQASTVLALCLLVADYILLSPNVFGGFVFGKITIFIYWVLQIALLSGARVAYRHFRYTRTLQRSSDGGAVPALIIGRSADAEVMLRAIESGAVTGLLPVGILSPSVADQGHTIRGIRVVGDTADLESAIEAIATRGGVRVRRLVFTPSAMTSDAEPASLMLQARRLGLNVSQLPSLDANVKPQLTPVAVEDLLLRPSVSIDYNRLSSFVRGKSIVVTGGGGSIGAEICDRVVTFGASRLLVIENAEYALHAILERLAGRGSSLEGRLADIRDRERIFDLLAAFKPDIVFHAAALKHVNLLEQDWDEGIKTNVLGSINVADAAAAAGVRAMVMISTDKAIEPVSTLGVTKRFAEMYCQALDSEFANLRGPDAMRLVSVRFGNVLASNGSVVPKFKAQIEAGGPVTVTHQDMVRYFMTIREACDLVVTSASHALGDRRADVSVYVLNMGQPVKIIDLAERMIRLSGLEPGRDIKIVFTGLRPGERLHELTFARDEVSGDIGIAGIVAAKPACPSMAMMRTWLDRLQRGLANGSQAEVFAVMSEAIPDFRPGSRGYTAPAVITGEGAVSAAGRMPNVMTAKPQARSGS